MGFDEAKPTMMLEDNKVQQNSKGILHTIHKQNISTLNSMMYFMLLLQKKTHLKYHPTQELITDLLTKEFSRPQFEKLCEEFGITNLKDKLLRSK